MKSSRKYGKIKKSKTAKKRGMMCEVCNCGMKCNDSCHKKKFKGGSDGLHAYPYGGPYIQPNPHYAYTQHGGNPGVFAYTGKKGGSTTTNGVPNSELLNQYVNRGLSGGGVPPPLVGSAWTPSPKSWPGVSGPHNGVNFPLNTYNNQPDTQGVIDERSNAYPTERGTVLMGGMGKKKTIKKRRMHRHKKIKGGTAVTGIFSQAGSSIQNAYATYTGHPPYPSPMPFKDQFQPNKY